MWKKLKWYTTMWKEPKAYIIWKEFKVLKIIKSRSFMWHGAMINLDYMWHGAMINLDYMQQHFVTQISQKLSATKSWI
jgi:hypothetical protein